MRYPINGLFALLAILEAGAWDTPLPSLVQPSGTDLAAFGNPAVASQLDNAGTGFSLGRPDSLEGPWDRSWGIHHQEGGQALGFRLWEGGAKTESELGWSAAKDNAGFLTSGARLAWRYREDASDRFGADAGIQVRPHPAFLAGYWGENLWNSGPVPRVHRWSLAVKPFAGFRNLAEPLSVGYGMDFPEDRSRREFVYLQVPLPFSTLIQGKWDWKEQAASLGITVQASGQMAAAWGLSGPQGDYSDWERPSHREAAVRFRKSRKTPYLLGYGKVAELDLNRSLVEGEDEASWLTPSGDLGYLELRRRLDLIDADPTVKAVLVRLGRARAGWGMGEEIRNRLLGFRARGMRVVAYMEQASPLNYYLASAAEVVAMQPGGHFAVGGFSSEVMFYRGFFDKVGVQPQFLRHGRYKAFEEPYTRKDLSPEARANLESYLASNWDHFLDAISSARGLSRDSTERALASGDPNLDHALRAGLIDTLVDQDQLLELAGGKGAAWVRLQGDQVYRGDWEIHPRVALVVVKGNMVMGRSSPGWLGSPELAGARSVAEQLKRARLDPDIKAVVIRMDSPGGSAQAADIMTREVELLRKAGKPVVASVGHMAASGGYYLVCGADRIYSSHNSAVGSIGILWGKFVLTGLYSKLGLATETVKTTPHADANSLSRTWDSTEVAHLQRHMDDFYDRFTSKVAAGRKLSREAVDSLAQGRIFTGSQAVRNGLVDSIAGLDAAIREAARLARIPDDRRVEVELVPARHGGGMNSASRVFPTGRVLPSGMRTAASGGDAALDGALQSLADRYAALTEAQLWAVSPELAGWTSEDAR